MQGEKADFVDNMVHQNRNGKKQDMVPQIKGKILNSLNILKIILHLKNTLLEGNGNDHNKVLIIYLCHQFCGRTITVICIFLEHKIIVLSLSLNELSLMFPPRNPHLRWLKNLFDSEMHDSLIANWQFGLSSSWLA